MEMLQEVLVDGVVSVLVVVIGILFTGIRTFILAKAKEMQVKTDKDDYALMRTIAFTVVEAVEQISGIITGPAKFGEAKDRLIEELEGRGINVSDSQMQTLIESAVKEMNETRDAVHKVLYSEGDTK